MHVQLEFCWIALQYLNIIQTYKCTRSWGARSFILLLLVVVASELFGSNYWLFKYRDREASIKILKCIWGWNARVKIITCLICDIFVLDNSFPHFNHWSKIVTFILYFMNTKKHTFYCYMPFIRFGPVMNLQESPHMKHRKNCETALKS